VARPKAGSPRRRVGGPGRPRAQTVAAQTVAAQTVAAQTVAAQTVVAQAVAATRPVSPPLAPR
jgi:hypothetical protein